MEVAELWETLKHAIEAYTGLSPATFFTVLALAAAFYHVVSGFLQAPPAPMKREVEFQEVEPLPPPVQLGEITEEELKVYDGSDPKKPLLMAIKSQIYDVSQSRLFYGPGGPYALFAGKDASRALAKMSFEPKDLTGDISGLGPFELDALQDWEYKFMSKYVKVGTIKKTVPVEDASACSASETAERAADTTDSSSPTDGEVGHAAESRETDQADHGAKSEHIAESKEDGPAGHGNEGEYKAESKDDGPAEHGDEADAVDHGADPKEVIAGEEMKE